MEKVELLLVALSASLSQPGHFALILEEPTSRRRIPLIIGSNEAQAIAISLEKLVPARPLTHDLFHTTLQALHTELEEVLLVRYEAEVFYAQLILKDPTGQRLVLDARPSDAIALAVRFGCPLFATADIVAAAAYAPDENNRNKNTSYQAFRIEELEKMLCEAIRQEDYEGAAQVRDALERRKRLE